MEMVYRNDSKSAEASRELMTHHGWLYDQRRIGNGNCHGPRPVMAAASEARKREFISSIRGEAASLFGNSHSY